jgi:hypothetical protein
MREVWNLFKTYRVSLKKNRSQVSEQQFLCSSSTKITIKFVLFSFVHFLFSFYFLLISIPFGLYWTCCWLFCFVLFVCRWERKTSWVLSTSDSRSWSWTGTF